MGIKSRLSRIAEVTMKKPYRALFILIAAAYLIIDIIINQIYVTFPYLLNYNLYFVIPSILLMLLSAVLVGISMNLIVVKFKEMRQLNKESGLTAAGMFAGILGGACPSCFVGLFPAFIGLFGITASLSSLPLYGIEIQIGSVLLLGIAIFFLTGSNTCKVKKK